MSLPSNFDPVKGTFNREANMSKEDWIKSRTDNPDKLGQKALSDYYDKLKKGYIKRN